MLKRELLVGEVCDYEGGMCVTVIKCGVWVGVGV